MTFAENVVSLHFDRGLLVTVLASVSYRPLDGSQIVTDAPPFRRTELVSLLGRSVVTGETPTPRKLTLGLDEGGPIVFADDSDVYESFVIRIGDEEIFI